MKTKHKSKSKLRRNLKIEGKTFTVEYCVDSNTGPSPGHKTILVVYASEHINPLAGSPAGKRYPFNTTDDLRVGDVIESNSYTTPMHVVEVLPHYKYVNIATCELSNTKAASTAQREIRPLILENARPTNAITARLLKRTAN